MLIDLEDVATALENEEVTAHFQPLIELQTGKLLGFEVLARWVHPKLGPILPPNFIALAEKHGLIGTLTEQVFRKAFLAARPLPESFTLAANISPVQMTDATLPQQIQEIAAAADFRLDRLTVEITETALFDNLPLAKKIAGELKDLGCSLALDDFGTGYSSLAYLQALPFDQLKIDRSFVSQMAHTRDSRKIVAAIVGLGYSLSLDTVAEGIETEELADMVLCLGCKQGQGWLYGRPVAAEELPALLAAPVRPASTVLSALGEGWVMSSLEALPTQRLGQLEAIYNGAPVGLCFLNRELRYVSLNRKLAEMNGASVASHLGKTFEEMNPKLFFNHVPFLQSALQGEALEGIEVARPAFIAGEPDRISLASYQPAWDEAGEIIGISICVQDTTESRRTADALRESDDHQRYLIGKSHQVPWIMDADGNSLQVNSQLLPCTRTLNDSSRHLGWLEALHLDDLAPTLKATKEALRTGDAIDVEYRVRVGGKWRWMRSRGSASLGPTGEISRWYGTVEDIDDYRQEAARA